MPPRDTRCLAITHLSADYDLHTRLMGELKQSRREFLRRNTEFDLSREVDGACRQRREEHQSR
jgi:hypothetical protein